MKQPLKKMATSQDIRGVLGPIDDEIVTAILGIRASPAEVMAAFEWLNDDDYMGAELKKSMSDNVQRIYEILQSDRDRFGPEER